MQLHDPLCSLNFAFSPLVSINGLNMYFTSLIMFTLSHELWRNTITMQEVLAKWEIITRLEEMCLISPIEWWWCAVTPPLCLVSLSRRREQVGSEKLFFIIPPTDLALYSTLWMWNPLEIENSEVIPAKQKSIPSNGTWEKAWRGEKSKQNWDRRLKCCWKTGTALHESWMIFTVLHRAELSSLCVHNNHR